MRWTDLWDFAPFVPMFLLLLALLAGAFVYAGDNGAGEPVAGAPELSRVDPEPGVHCYIYVHSIACVRVEAP